MALGLIYLVPGRMTANNKNRIPQALRNSISCGGNTNRRFSWLPGMVY
jgi:hypothetical protein